MADWLEGWEQRPRSDSGPMLRDAGRCLLLHTMEGSFAGGVGTLDRNNNWPHLAYDPATRRKIQAIPFSRAGKSLANKAGGVETNRWGVIQVELSGFAGESHTWPDSWLSNIAEDVVAPVMAAQGVKAHAPPFYGTDAGFTLATANAPQRMSFDAWLVFDGVCGHQHAPENDHWDPGKLDVPRILELATGSGDDDVPGQLFSVTGGAGPKGPGAIYCLVGNTYTYVGHPDTLGVLQFIGQTKPGIAELSAAAVSGMRFDDDGSKVIAFLRSLFPKRSAGK